MTSLKTSESLLKALTEASSRVLSHDEMQQQRVSFVMSSLSEKNDMTREQVQSVIRQDGGVAKK